MMKRSTTIYFTLIEIICAIVILSFALTTIVVVANQNMIKVITSGVAVKCALAAENKLNEYRMMPWSEIPASDSGLLLPKDTEAYKYEMISENSQNEYGCYVHILLKVTFPASNSNKENGFYLETDIAVPGGDSLKMEEAIRNSSVENKP